jgi:hypothetical protein
MELSVGLPRTLSCLRRYYYLMRRTRSFLLPGLVVPVIVACADLPTRVVDAASSSTFQAGPLDAHFEAAAREFGIPSALLKAVAYAETRMQMVRGDEEFEGQPAAFGVMALRGERLTRAATLAGVSTEAAQTDPGANIRAGAALLREYARELSVDRTRIGDWASAVARYSGIGHPQAVQSYVHGEVYGLLRRGLDVEQRGHLAQALRCSDPSAAGIARAGLIPAGAGRIHEFNCPARRWRSWRGAGPG